MVGTLMIFFVENKNYTFGATLAETTPPPSRFKKTVTPEPGLNPGQAWISLPGHRLVFIFELGL